MPYMDRLKKAFHGITSDSNGVSITYHQLISNLRDLFCGCRSPGTANVYFVGNGGSAGIALHMTSDYLKNGSIRTHSLHDPTTLTCIANDFGYENVFSKQLEIVGKEDDILVAISSSGNSLNIINAVKIAREKGCRIVTLTGFQPNNKLRNLGDINVYVPCMEYGIVESIHNMILQQAIDEILVLENRRDIEK